MSQPVTDSIAARAPVAPTNRTETVTAFTTLIPVAVHWLYLLTGGGAADPFDFLGMLIDALYFGSIGATGVAVLIVIAKRLWGRERPTKPFVTVTVAAVGLHLLYALIVLPTAIGMYSAAV